MADGRERTCEQCGSIFHGRKRRFCYECLVDHKLDPDLYRRQYNSLDKIERACLDCGQIVRVYRTTKRCRSCTEKNRRRGLIKRPCRTCGSEFTPWHRGLGSMTFCSEECIPTKICSECGAAFQSFNESRVTCSRICIQARRVRENRESGRRRRIRRRGAVRGPYHDLEIFDRDGWRCQICGGLTRPWYRVPHPLAPTIDHIVPISKGGADVPTNVQCAHLKCNVQKQAGAVDDQLRLIG